MKVSVSMYSLHKVVNKENWGVMDFIQYANEIQLDGVELLDIYWKDKDAEINAINEALAANDMKVSAYDVTNNFVSSSEEERKTALEKVTDGIHTAKRLGTNVVRVFCGDLHGDLTYEQGQQWIVKGLQEAAKLAEQEKVYLAIENHGLLAGRSEQVLDIISKVNSPYVKSTFDTGNFLLVHQEPTNSFTTLKEEIVHVHFKDFRKKQQEDDVIGFRSIEGEELIGTIPGDGQVDLKFIVDGLKEVGYDGWLSVEYEGIEEPKAATIESVRRLRELLR